MASTRWAATWLFGTATLSLACVDALRLEPPTPAGTGGAPASSSQTGMGGGGGGAAIACASNSDCPEPTSVCDLVKGECTECLVLADCGLRPGTVCSKGACVCPDSLEYCGPNLCQDLTSSQEHCGKCDHACFGTCAAGACVDAWEPVGKKDAPSPRYQHVAVWTGSKMVVWGGLDNQSPTGSTATGAIYDPVTFSWKATALVGAPTHRHSATAVWTGSEMLVWGGRTAQGLPLGDGARFDLAKNAWSPMSMSGAPTPRSRHSAVWSGTEMIVWGGFDSSNELQYGARYSPSADTWTSIVAQPTPVASRADHCGVWDKNKSLMFLLGGFGDNIDESLTDLYWGNGNVSAGVAYNPQSESWVVLSSLAEPSARSLHTCVFDGQRTLVFGGANGSQDLNSGAAYDPLSGWTSFGGNLPDARRNHTAVWLDTKKVMVVFGGTFNNAPLDTGAVFDSTANLWIKPTPRILSARRGHSAVSTGDRMIVWGGLNNSEGMLRDGGIYTP